MPDWPPFARYAIRRKNYEETQNGKLAKLKQVGEM